MRTGALLLVAVAFVPQAMAAGAVVKKPNVAPSVHITSPTSTDPFTAPAIVTITADASDSDGTIKSVKFFADGGLVATATQAPYSAKWKDAPAGAHSLTAVALDNGGAETTSAVQIVNVRPNTPPTVQLTSPAGGATFIDPATIAISADAGDSDGTVKSVRFFADGALLGTTTKAPYAVKWKDAPFGVHSLTAVALDNGGGETISAAVTITVRENTPPTVQLTSPAGGAMFIIPPTIALSAEAADGDGSVKLVRFFADDLQIGAAREAPYAAVWHHAPTGTFHLTAVATDNLGASTTSAPVTITVKPNMPPQVQLTAPAAGTSVNEYAPVTVSANATDSDGSIKVVRFYSGATRIGGTRVAPYSITWRRPPVGTHILTAVAIDNLGGETRSAAVTLVVKANTPPSVSLTAPTNHANYPTAPATIAVAAAASDSEGTVRRVDFYASCAGGGPMLIGRRYAAPYSVLWKHVAAGAYTLTAVATDDHGLNATSAPIGITVGEDSPPPPPSPSTAPLVQPSNLVFEGAFRVPNGSHPGAHLDDWSIEHGWDSFQYGGLAMGVDPAHNSIFMVGNNQGALVAEIGVPSLVPASEVAGLSVASLQQPFADPTEGLIDTINPGSDNSKKIGGLLPDPDHNRLFTAAYDYYDGTGSQQLSHFVSSLDMSLVGNVLGPYQVGTIGAGFVDGYFGLVPPEWQAAIGGPVINGNCCLGVISRTSYGPALFAIDPAMLGSSPLPATPLVYYPRLHPLLEPGLTPCPDPNTCDPVVDGWNSQSTLFNGTTEVRGVAFPTGWRSVLFFGRHGVGEFCYGFGTDQPDLVGTIPDGDGNIDPYCMDPEDDSKGVHAWPYLDYVWAYDANDLASAAAGARDPWTVRPYAVFELKLPFKTTGGTHMSATYDPSSGRIYVSQYQGDDVLPLIYVFKLQP